MEWPLLRAIADGHERSRKGVLAEGVRFELTREQSPLPVFKTGALNHSATLPHRFYGHFLHSRFPQKWKLAPDWPRTHLVRVVRVWRAHFPLNSPSIAAAARSSGLNK